MMNRPPLALFIVLICAAGILPIAAQPLPVVISGLAHYENGMGCDNFTLHITNLKTSTTWQADTRRGGNYYRLVLDGSEAQPGDVLQFVFRNADAGTLNTSLHTLDDANRSGMRYDITFVSIDVAIMMLDANGTIHYKHLFLNNESDFKLLNATGIACDMLNRTFELSGGNVTRIGGIDDPVVHLYNESEGWVDVALHHRLNDCDSIIWSDAEAELPALLPDLSIAGKIRLGSEPHTKFTTTVETTITNRGAAISDRFDVAFIVDGEPLDVKTLSPLSPMDDRTVTFMWGPEDAGNRTIAIEIDPTGAIDEPDKSNNNAQVSVVVEESRVITIPYDYPTAQMAVDSATAYTLIYINEGEYNGWLTIKDKQRIKVIGTNENAKLVIHDGNSDMIRISNSSDIDLTGFTAMAKRKDWYVDYVRIIAVYDSDNISLTNLVLDHDSWQDCSFLMWIDNSVNCVVSDNFMSGSRSPADWSVCLATAGIFIASDNNTVRNNTIDNCCYAIKVIGTNNTIHSNNLFASARDSGYNNHWNASSPVCYRHNGTTFTDYIGNYYDAYRDQDLDDNGIWDTPYNINENTSDYQPLREPYWEEYALCIRSISLPNRPYAEQNNTIIAAISQNSQRNTDITIDLMVNSEVLESKRVKLSKISETTLKFHWTPGKPEIYNISLVASINDSITSFRTSRSLFVKVHGLPYNCSDNVTAALQFLRAKQTPQSGSIGSFSTSAWAALAFSAAGDNPGAELTGFLSGYPSLPENEFVLATFEDCARTCLAISTSGGVDPTNFGGINYLTLVKSYHDGVQFNEPTSVNDDALGILALTAYGDPNSTGIIDHSVGYITSHQNGDGGWSKKIEDPAWGITEGNTTDGNTTSGIASDLRTTSLVIQALVAAGESPDSGVITNASSFLRNNTGVAGNLSDAVTTAYAVQAILAMGKNPLGWRDTNSNESATPIDYLLCLQQPDGSFNYTANGSLFPLDITAKVVPALAACPHPPMVTDIDSYPLPEITPIGYIDVPETIYVNTSCTVYGRLECNGGRFNVSLLEDGIPASVTTLRSLWCDSEILFSIEWTPSVDGPLNISIFVDSSKCVDETNENNNNISGKVFVNLPDLIISNISLPNRIVVNATNIINTNVCGRTDEHFNVTFLANGREVDRRRLAGITDTANLSFEWVPDSTGIHNISFIADSDNAVREACETNNIAAADAGVFFTDLVPVNLTPRVAFVHARNNITVVINGTAEGFNVSLVENGTAVADITNITSYEQKYLNLTYKPESLGNHTVTVEIDSDGDIRETDESNNNLSSVINVTLTDLVPRRVIPDVMYLNRTNDVIVPVNGTAEGFNVTLIAYARDAPNGTITIVNETGNTTSTINITNPMIVNATDLDTYDNNNLTIGWTPYWKGWHDLTVVVDAGNDVNETDESNNNITSEVFVANKIKLELVSPRGGKVLGGTQPIKWKAIHDRNLSIGISYSPNYGIDWILLASNLTCDPALTANLSENLIRDGSANNTTNTTNDTGVDYNGVYMWNTRDISDGEYLVRITARWYILEAAYTSNTVIVLNGDAASGGLGGNARYFDWDTPDEPHLAWVSEDIFAGSSTSIVVADDKVFVYCTGGGSEYAYMVALNATNGEMLWATRIDAAQYWSWASPSYHNKSIFIASGAHLYRIDGGTGKILWDYRFSDCGANCNGGPSVCGGKVFVASFAKDMHAGDDCQGTPGNMFCIDEGTGKELWNTGSYLSCGSHLGSPTPKYGRIYYGRDTEVYCLTLGGRVVWTTSLGDSVYCSPVVVDGVVYAATYDFEGYGGLTCLDAFNGSTLWNYPVQRTDSTPAYFAPRDSDEKYIYIVGGCAGFSGDGVYCFNATNGSLIWGMAGLGSWTNSPAVSRDARVFVGVTGGWFGYSGLKCLDAYNGTELWSSPYGGSSPYIAYGRIYTIGGNRLYAFGKRELPDLVVTAASASDGVVHATIENIGTGGTNESFRVALTRGGTRGGECTVGALNASESVAVTLSGVCGWVMVTADSDSDIPEHNEYNNMKEVWVSCGDGGGRDDEGDEGCEGDGDGGGDEGDEGDGNDGSDYGSLGSGGGSGGSGGGGYRGMHPGFSDGTDDAEITTETGVEAVVNKTESTGSEQKAKGYPMGTKFNTGGSGGGYFSYIMILAVLTLIGLLVQGIRKERGRYRRYMK